MRGLYASRCPPNRERDDYQYKATCNCHTVWMCLCVLCVCVPEPVSVSVCVFASAWGMCACMRCVYSVYGAAMYVNSLTRALDAWYSTECWAAWLVSNQRFYRTVKSATLCARLDELVSVAAIPQQWEWVSRSLSCVSSVSYSPVRGGSVILANHTSEK